MKLVVQYFIYFPQVKDQNVSFCLKHLWGHQWKQIFHRSSYASVFSNFVLSKVLNASTSRLAVTWLIDHINSHQSILCLKYLWRCIITPVGNLMKVKSYMSLNIFSICWTQNFVTIIWWYDQLNHNLVMIHSRRCLNTQQQQINLSCTS